MLGRRAILAAQPVESRDTATADAEAEGLSTSLEYVWSARYVDAAVLRDVDSTRYYYLGDANYNVTTLVDTSGNAREHYRYRPYGTPHFLNGGATDTEGAEWTGDAASDVDNHTLFTGRWLDYVTMLYQYRNRYCHGERPSPPSLTAVVPWAAGTFSRTQGRS